jgi:hypothetical protein
MVHANTLSMPVTLPGHARAFHAERPRRRSARPQSCERRLGREPLYDAALRTTGLGGPLGACGLRGPDVALLARGTAWRRVTVTVVRARTSRTKLSIQPSPRDQECLLALRFADLEAEPAPPARRSRTPSRLRAGSSRRRAASWRTGREASHDAPDVAQTAAHAGAPAMGSDARAPHAPTVASTITSTAETLLERVLGFGRAIPSGVSRRFAPGPSQRSFPPRLSPRARRAPNADRLTRESWRRDGSHAGRVGPATIPSQCLSSRQCFNLSASSWHDVS